MRYARLVGTGSALPKRRLTNAELAKQIDTTDEWIQQRVGIRERRISSGSEDETTSALALKAAEAAIEAAQIDVQSIELIVVGSVTADYLFPSVASQVQHGLGIKNRCPALDVNAACSGFIYGLSIADQYIKTAAVKTALVIGAEALSRVVDWQDRSTCVLFGDGAGAAVLIADEAPGIVLTHIQADGQYLPMLHAKSGVWTDDPKAGMNMDGTAVFKQAVATLGAIVDDTLAKAGLSKSDIDWLIPHQANMRIIEATAKRLGLPMSQVIMTIGEHGNTSAASVPLALDHAIRSGQVTHGETLMLEAFGAGFTWGSALIHYT